MRNCLAAVVAITVFVLRVNAQDATKQNADILFELRQ